MRFFAKTNDYKKMKLLHVVRKYEFLKCFSNKTILQYDYFKKIEDW